MTPQRWARIKDVFGEAFERPEAERASFLDSACKGDTELRADVERLLAESGEDSLQSPGLQFLARELSPGDTVEHYRIQEKLGEGGMGVVYKASDSRLGRSVALKFVKTEFSSRSQREARAVASLNHPNICTLHDVGPNYLVMELVEGPTLAERIAKGPIPVPEALEIARQIAEALEAAHEKGIVHRDLKPANIKLTSDGKVKVLDFGLAKTLVPRASGSPEDSPTRTLSETRAGMILGTAAYMSPEQARGKPVDARADVWAFGVVLYEMVTGQKLFEGDGISEILAAVLKEEPRLERAPEKLRRLLRSSLQKDPEQRLRAIGDWRLLLDGPPLTGARERSARWMWPAAAAMIAIAAVIAFWAPWRKEKNVDLPLVRLDVDLGAGLSLPPTNNAGSTVAISPDGTRLAYSSGTPARLFTRKLDQPTATELPGTQGASIPFFSPDGQWVGFRSARMLNKISVAGGAVIPVGEVGANFSGASWGDDGSIFISTAYQKGVQRIPPSGGPPESIAELGNGEVGLMNPQILPGGKAVLLSVDNARGLDRNTIEVLTLADHHRKVVAQGGGFARYLATSSGIGHLVYVNQATLFAVPFDLAKLETRGTAVPVLDDVAHLTNRAGLFDFSSAPAGHGTLVYRKASGGAGMVTLEWVDQAGKREPLRAKPGVYTGHPALSPDGKRIALTDSEGGTPNVWVYDPQRDAMTRLTFGGAMYRWPTWSPDGRYVLFTSDGNGILQAPADGAGQPHALSEGKPFQWPMSFTPDGKRLLYFEAAGNYQIWTVPVEDTGIQLKTGKPEQFLKSSFNDVYPVFSPDGRWVAYRSDESGKQEVYVRAFPPPKSAEGGKWQISDKGGDRPRWSRNGHELLYQSGDQIMAVSYTVAGGTFVAEKPRVWLAKFGGTGWDLAPDGKRLLVLMPVESPETPKQEHEIVMLLNFLDELRRKVPVGK